MTGHLKQTLTTDKQQAEHYFSLTSNNQAIPSHQSVSLSDWTHHITHIYNISFREKGNTWFEETLKLQKEIPTHEGSNWLSKHTMCFCFDFIWFPSDSTPLHLQYSSSYEEYVNNLPVLLNITFISHLIHFPPDSAIIFVWHSRRHYTDWLG
jgi:hypothetical protein